MKIRQVFLVAAIVSLPSLARAQVTMQTADPQTGQLGRAPIAVLRCEQNGTAVACDGPGITPLGKTATAYSYQSTASTNATNIVATQATVLSVIACNQAASLKYVRLYNKSNPPVSTDTPAWRGSLPSNGGCVTIFNSPVGALFTNGISFEITSGAPDNDATITTANDVSLNVAYK